MGVIRVVWGSATGPTETSAYDAALAEANVHDYNLVTVSSVIPADASLEVVGTAPDLGPTGERLTVVQGRGTVAPAEDGSATAALGWARSASGEGLFYEDDGEDPDTVRERVDDGLQAGVALRDWEPVDHDVVVRTVAGDAGAHACVVVCAVYGASRPLL